jgi:threonyl-tRNA synthetase
MSIPEVNTLSDQATIKITLPDGSVREMPKGSTSMDLAQSISEGLAPAH